MKKITNLIGIFPIYILNLLLFVQTQFEDESALKALSCVSIVTQKYKVGEEEPTSYSPIVLSCYIKITEEQARKVLAGIEEGIDALEPYEIDELTDVDSLRDIPQDEIKQKSEELENTIKEFQKLDEDFSKMHGKEMGDYDDDEDDEYDDDDYEDDDEFDTKNKVSKKGIFKLIKKGISNLFKVFGSIWYVIFFLIGLYFFLMALRKSSEDLEKINKKKSDDKENENKIENEEDKKEEKEKEKSKEIDKEKEKAKAD